MPMENFFTYKTVENLTVALPESAVLSRLGRNRFLSNISNSEQVKLKMLMLKAFTQLRPRGRWMLQSIVDRTDREVILPGNRVLHSEAFARFCGDAPLLWLGAVTVGSGIADLMSDPSAAISEKVVFDAVGSECADDCLGNLQNLAAMELARHNLIMQKMRFSPGYGNLSLGVQEIFFDLLQLPELGMTLTESKIMQPEKSVTAFAAVLKMN